MDPHSGKFVPLKEDVRDQMQELESQMAGQVALGVEAQLEGLLLRPDGTPVPKHWAIFTQDELVEIKGYTFRVKYIGETAILFEPVKAADLSDALVAKMPREFRQEVQRSRATARKRKRKKRRGR